MATSDGDLYIRENKPSTAVWSLALIVVGLVLIFGGGFVSYVYFTEITPPTYEAYHQRYVGSSFPRVSGILMLVAGLVLFWGGSIFMAFSVYRNSSRAAQASRYYYYYHQNSALPRSSNQAAVKEPCPA